VSINSSYDELLPCLILQSLKSQQIQKKKKKVAIFIELEYSQADDLHRKASSTVTKIY